MVKSKSKAATRPASSTLVAGYLGRLRRASAALQGLFKVALDLEAERDAYREAYLALRAYKSNNTGANAVRLRAAVAALPK